MSARGKRHFLMRACVSFLLAVVVNAAADKTPDTAEDTPIAQPCVDLNAACSTLMINYYGDSVEFSLFQRASSKGSAYSIDNKLPGGVKVKPDSNEQLLGIDFLRGFNTTSDTGAFQGKFSTRADGPVEARGLHDWTFAAATSMGYSFQQSNPDGIAAPSDLVRHALTFWDFEHVYQWQVEENVHEGGRYDLSQLVLSDIYLSSKANSNSDPKVVVCEVNDKNNC
jgi:hypothetical protein